jgi:hypothetical protein
MDSTRKKEVLYKLFDLFYGGLEPNDNNLDKHVNFIEDGKRKLYLVPFIDDRFLLGYYKVDFDKMKKYYPGMTKWFFEKYIVQWMKDKYGFNVDSTLLPIKRQW